LALPSLQDLLDAGTHFGHQTRRWNPKMRRFIFAERSGIYLIDLQKTLKQLTTATELLKSVALKGENILFVCTKRQLKAVVEGEARNANCHYVTERWLGGTLTNFQTIKKQIHRLRELEQGAAEGDFENYTKKEQLLFSRERVKLSRNLEGIKMMNRLPGALFIVDAKKEKIAIQEANRLGIPVVAIVDTNADPDVITVPIPGNDDAIRSVSMITGALCDALREARAVAALLGSHAVGVDVAPAAARVVGACAVGVAEGAGAAVGVRGALSAVLAGAAREIADQGAVALLRVGAGSALRLGGDRIAVAAREHGDQQQRSGDQRDGEALHHCIVAHAHVARTARRGDTPFHGC